MARQDSTVWRRLRPRARLFIGVVLLIAVIPSVASVPLELVWGPSALVSVLPWAGCGLALACVFLAVRPRSASPRAWLEQLRQRIAAETLP